MAKIDKVKEILNALRVGLSIIVGLLVVVTGALISKEQSNQIDIYFWLGLILEIVLIVGFLNIIFSIKKHTNELEDL